MIYTVPKRYDVKESVVKSAINAKLRKGLARGEQRELSFEVVDQQTSERREVTFVMKRMMRTPDDRVVCTGHILLSRIPVRLTIYKAYGTALFEELS